MEVTTSCHPCARDGILPMTCAKTSQQHTTHTLVQGLVAVPFSCHIKVQTFRPPFHWHLMDGGAGRSAADGQWGQQRSQKARPNTFFLEARTTPMNPDHNPCLCPVVGVGLSGSPTRIQVAFIPRSQMQRLLVLPSSVPFSFCCCWCRLVVR